MILKVPLRIICLPALLWLFTSSSFAQSISTGSISGSPFSLGASVNVSYTILGSFNAGNVFTAQLSDAAGAFTSPTAIGTLSSTTAGTIAATIPAGALPGAAYRIRVVASDPFTIGADNGANLAISEPQNALNFDASNDVLDCGTGSNLDITTGTWEAWVRTASLGVSRRIIFKEISDGTGTGRYELFLFASGNKFRANAIVGGTVYNVVGTTTPTTGTWYHVAATYDGEDLKIYVNGVLENTNSTPSGLMDPGTGHLGVGRNVSGTSSNPWNGDIDEVRIWDRVLCQQEIYNNMSGTLPAGQTGLVAYYKMNKGIPGGNNSSVTSVPDESGNGNIATPTNFGLSASTSNFVSSAVTNTAVPVYAQLASATASKTQTISGTTEYKTTCNESIVNITPSGASPLAGSVLAKVTIDGSVQSYGGLTYLQRHYDIEPASSPNSSTASITLFWTQAEFTAFNATTGHGLDLPINAADVAGNKANLRITQRHGVPTGGNTPGNYPASWAGAGPVAEVITPTVTWNASASRWEATFPVTGFSGFFGSTSLVPLPVGFTEFTARPTGGNKVMLGWHIANPSLANSFVVERSTDGVSFTSIGRVPSSSATAYSFYDRNPVGGKNYYRIMGRDNQGISSYTKTESIFMASIPYVLVTPSPVIDYLIIETNLVDATASVVDVQGKILTTFPVVSGAKISVAHLPAGLYLLKLSNGDTIKLIKE